MALVLDTHAVIWYLRASKDLSPTALQAIRHTVSTGRPVHVSAISLIEAIYLTEKGRLPVEALGSEGDHENPPQTSTIAWRTS